MKCVLLLAVLCSATVMAIKAPAAERLCDHEVVLDKDGRLLPWTSYDHVLKGSMNYIKHCPTVVTKFGDDPWYLVTSKLTEKAEFMRNQNCQGSHAYWGIETLTRYYAYSGDEEAIRSIKLIIDRVLFYHTPPDWAWPNVPRTQDNSPDGEYTDETSETDKIAMVGVAYIKFYKLTGEEKYLQAARGIAQTLASHVTAGDATNSPLPFRVNLKDGKVLDAYTASTVAAVLFFDEMIRLGELGNGLYQAKRDIIWKWVLAYPLTTHEWTGYYEDVGSTTRSLNQQCPMETARFMLRRPEFDPDYRWHVPGLLAWVKDSFGQTRRFGATSIREQTCCFFEMSSHTARYASIAAKWFGVTRDPRDREEARASFALATYSASSKYSHQDDSVNYVGIGYVNPWFIDSYFDYLSHILEGMAELP
jgi:Glycosyl hydrolase family 76